MLQDYELGIQNLEALLPRSERQKIGNFVAQLRENLEEEYLFGANEESRSRRNKILYKLNSEALQLTNYSFNDLCNRDFEVKNVKSHLVSSDDITLQEVEVLNHLNQYFNLEEMKTLCFQIGIDFEQVSGLTKNAKACELILLAKRTEKYENLLCAIQRLRPNLR